MRVVRLASETDFAGWRAAARTLRAAGVAPEGAIWTVDGSGGLSASQAGGGRDDVSFTVPRGFLQLAAPAALHRSPERFALLYRILWRLGREPDLLRLSADPDVAKARAFAQAVDRAAHKMKAFVDFHRVEEPETFAAWYEPAHRVAERTAPFFVRRFAGKRFSLLTPDVCLHWDGEALAVTPGADPADAPAGDSLEDYWRAHYASVFDPVRRNLPAPRLIPEPVESAESRTAAMVSHPAPEPSRRAVRAALRHSRDASYEDGGPTSLEEVAAGVDACRRCDLWRNATQGVPGEGQAGARLMLVGEQPGDREDLAGRPFVGPAGQVLDKALAAAGAPRGETYVTNAVKHFKHELRGKRRLHKTPDAGEVAACRWWLDHERAIVRPRVIVALGATAAQAAFGRPVPIGKSRGQALQLSDQAQGVVTYHPSYLLRLPDADAKAKAFELFVQDLKFAWSLVG
ncbi:UdgX family uracil-DNA binding protein [Phenylobacterium sp.]|jgi:DNA polymerase|uniref:UdgX family uracil-DNA binding protein n=1 Tax=Phenylobacterium sp. TaxID=1871053 RepID=UPI002F3E5446